MGGSWHCFSHIHLLTTMFPSAYLLKNHRKSPFFMGNDQHLSTISPCSANSPSSLRNLLALGTKGLHSKGAKGLQHLHFAADLQRLQLTVKPLQRTYRKKYSQGGFFHRDSFSTNLFGGFLSSKIFGITIFLSKLNYVQEVSRKIDG